MDRSLPAWAGNSCTAAFDSACWSPFSAGGTIGLLKDQPFRTALPKSGRPLANGMGIPSQCIGRGFALKRPKKLLLKADPAHTAVNRRGGVCCPDHGS